MRSTGAHPTLLGGPRIRDDADRSHRRQVAGIRAIRHHPRRQEVGHLGPRADRHRQWREQGHEVSAALMAAS